MARFVPHGGTVACGKPIFAAVAVGSGQAEPGVSVQLVDFPVIGRAIGVAIAMPKGSLIACLKLDEVACLQDELDRAVAELTGTYPAGGAA